MMTCIYAVRFQSAWVNNWLYQHYNVDMNTNQEYKPV